MEVTKPQRIIFVDDYYNPNWPGVQEGIAKFYLSNSARFVPLLFTCNKLFLCNLSYHKMYLDLVSRFVRQNFPDTRIKLVRRFGFDTVTVLPNFKSSQYLVLEAPHAPDSQPTADGSGQKRRESLTASRS